MKTSHYLGSPFTPTLAQYQGCKEALLNSYTEDWLASLNEYSKLFYWIKILECELLHLIHLMYWFSYCYFPKCYGTKLCCINDQKIFMVFHHQEIIKWACGVKSWRFLFECPTCNTFRGKSYPGLFFMSLGEHSQFVSKYPNIAQYVSVAEPKKHWTNKES